jgi:hypothetical protein
VANRTDEQRVEAIAALRRLRMTAAEIAEVLKELDPERSGHRVVIDRRRWRLQLPGRVMTVAAVQSVRVVERLEAVTLDEGNARASWAGVKRGPVGACSTCSAPRRRLVDADELR